jgi:hypothetical protein
MCDGRQVKPRVLIISTILVAVVAAIVVVIVVVSQPKEQVAERCSELDVGFATDDAMRQAAEKLKTDSSVVDPVGETKKDGYERYMRQYKDQPEVAALTKPETFPANVRVKPADPKVDRFQLIGDLQRKFPEAHIVDPCNIPTIPPAT